MRQRKKYIRIAYQTSIFCLVFTMFTFQMGSLCFVLFIFNEIPEPFTFLKEWNIRMSVEW